MHEYDRRLSRLVGLNNLLLFARRWPGRWIPQRVSLTLEVSGRHDRTSVNWLSQREAFSGVASTVAAAHGSHGVAARAILPFGLRKFRMRRASMALSMGPIY